MALASKGVAAVGVAAVVAGVKAAGAFSSFDAQMSQVQAATRATGSELDALRQAAIDLGASTVFSAEEAAAPDHRAGKAGVSSADILNGGLAGALDLAAAGEIEVAEAAEIAASALTSSASPGRTSPTSLTYSWRPRGRRRGRSATWRQPSTSRGSSPLRWACRSRNHRRPGRDRGGRADRL